MKKYHNFVDLLIYLIILKNIFFFNYGAEKIIEIKFIKL